MFCTIDCLGSLWHGGNTVGCNRAVYTRFVEKYFPRDRCHPERCRYDPEELYVSLRCGLLHMFTIQGGKYALTHNNPELHLKKCRGSLILNAGDFRDDLRIAKEKYFDDVVTDPDLLQKVRSRIGNEGFLGLLRIGP